MLDAEVCVLDRSFTMTPAALFSFPVSIWLSGGFTNEF
jgi:hypothetical protein